VIAGASKTYNCISWSLGVTDHWVNPETGPAYAPLSRMDRMYAELGYYREHDLNWRVEPGLEKVVLYATLNADGTIKEVTHAAHEEADGTFTSKLGQLPVIRHDTPGALKGPTYGLPVAVYVRPIDGNAK
jgi:type VI secretion system secreted protein VgrG